MTGKWGKDRVVICHGPQGYIGVKKILSWGKIIGGTYLFSLVLEYTQIYVLFSTDVTWVLGKIPMKIIQAKSSG